MKLIQQQADTKKVGDQPLEDCFETVSTLTTADSGRHQSSAFHNPAAETRRVNDTNRDLEFALAISDNFFEPPPSDARGDMEARIQDSVSLLRRDCEVFEQRKEQFKLFQANAENELRQHREKISRMGEAIEQAEARLEEKQKKLDDSAIRLEEQRLALATAAERQSENLIRQQQASSTQVETHLEEKKRKSLDDLAIHLEEQRLALAIAAEQQSENLIQQQLASSTQLETSLRLSEKRLERKRKTLRKLERVVKTRRRTQKELAAKQLANIRSQEQQTKYDANRLLIEKQQHQSEYQAKIDRLDQNHAAMLAESEKLEKQRLENDLHQQSIETRELELEEQRNSIELKLNDFAAQQREHDLRRTRFEDQKNRTEHIERRQARIENSVMAEAVAKSSSCRNELTTLTDVEFNAGEPGSKQHMFDEMQSAILSNLRWIKFKKTKLYRGCSWLLNLITFSKNETDCVD